MLGLIAVAFFLATSQITNADDDATVTAEYEDAKKSVDELKATIDGQDALSNVEKQKMGVVMNNLRSYLDESKNTAHHSPGHFRRFTVLTQQINGKLNVNLQPSSSEEIALEMARAMTYVSVAIPGPLGVALSTLGALLVHMMEIGNPDLTVAGIVNALLEKHFALNEFQEISREVKGFAAKIDSLQLSINRARDFGVTKMTQTDLDRFLGKFDYDIEKQLGELEQYVHTKAKVARNEQEVTYVLQASRMYAQLCNLDRILRHELRAVLGPDKRMSFTVVDIGGAIEGAEQRAKRVFGFFETPNKDNLVSAINLNEAKYAALVQFLISVGLNPFAQQQELTESGKCYRIRGIYWDEWYVTRSSTGNTVFQAYMKKNIAREGNRGKFKFEGSELEDYIKIISRDPAGKDFAVCTVGSGRSRGIRLALNRAPFKECKNRFRFMKIDNEKGGFKWYFIDQSRGFTPMTLNSYAVSPLEEPEDDGDQFWTLEEVGC